jgi:hypothetical protein
MRGYFGYSGCVLCRRHIENSEPRPLRMTFWCAQLLQSPAAGKFTRMSIPRAAPLALAVLAVGCGGDDKPKSDEYKAAEVAKQYVASTANNEEEKCAETLATGVDKTLCDDLGPLAARVNPEEKKTTITGTNATVTVTGAGNNTRIDVTLVKQGGEWKVKRWRGYAVPPGS